MKLFRKKTYLAYSSIFSLIFLVSLTIVSVTYPTLNWISEFNTYFGNLVEDKYAILEHLDDPDVKNWFQKEEKLCDSVLSSIPSKNKLKVQFEDAVFSSNMRGGFPRVGGENIFYVRTYLKEKTQKIYYRKGITGKDIELFNANDFYKSDKSFNIDYFEPSYDGKYLAFGISSNGNEMSTIHIVDVDNIKILPERIRNSKYGNINWIYKSYSFFYCQTDEVGPNLDSKNIRETAKVKIHSVSTKQEKDVIAFSRENNVNTKIQPIDLPLIFTYPNSNFVLLAVYTGTDRYASLYYASLDDIKDKLVAKNNLWKKIATSDDKIIDFALYNSTLYILSFENNPNGSLEKIDFIDGKKTQTIFNSDNEVLDGLMLCKDILYLKKDKNGVSSILGFNLKDNSRKNVILPFNGYAGIKYSNEFLTNNSLSANLYFSLESWDKEVAVYYFDELSEKIFKTDLRKQSPYGYPDDLIVEELEILSHDSTLVPLSILRSKNTKLDGMNPTIISAYGAYGISINSSFDLARLVWLRKGGIFAFAHVRGGGEKGDNWYKSGYQSTKENSWKDFIACSEYLIKKKYTSNEKLAARGASAGAITIGRAITDRPDLYKAAIIEVGALNPLKLEKSRNASRGNEFGSVSDSAGFKNLLGMDTYHHIKSNVSYPSILFTAGMNDSRIDPWQSAKAVASFQEVSRNKENIILYRVTNLGHFGDSDRISLLTDIYGFLFWQLGAKWN